MSVQAVSWVLRGGPDGTCIDVPSSRHTGPLAVRLVLLVLAEHADANGRGACPSQRTIAAETGLDHRRSVEEALRLLGEAGLIAKTANARPRVHGAVFDLAMNSAGHPLPSKPPHEVETRPGIPCRVDLGITPNSAGHSAGHSAGIPRHEPEPEPSIHPRDSYASADERRLTVEQIRQLRTAKIDEGRDQLDDERLAQRAKNSRTAVA